MTSFEHSQSPAFLAQRVHDLTASNQLLTLRLQEITASNAQLTQQLRETTAACIQMRQVMEADLANGPMPPACGYATREPLAFATLPPLPPGMRRACFS